MPEHVPYDVAILASSIFSRAYLQNLTLTSYQSDYFHTEHYPLIQRYTGTNDGPYSDKNLINGKMNRDYSLVNRALKVSLMPMSQRSDSSVGKLTMYV